mgnify:CR=1 FL=1
MSETEETEEMKGTDNYGITQNEYSQMINKILEVFENGQFQYDTTKSAQSEGYRNKKKLCRQMMKIGLSSVGKKYFRSMLSLVLDNVKQDDDKQQQMIDRLVKENHELIVKNKYCQKFHTEEHMESWANALSINKLDEFKKKYVCEKEDVIELNTRIKSLQEEKRYFQDLIKELNETMKEMDENHKEKNATQAYEYALLHTEKEDKSEVKKLKEEITEINRNHKIELKKSKDEITEINKNHKIELKKLTEKNKELEEEIKLLKSSGLNSEKEKKYKNMIKELKNKLTNLEIDNM